jgi:hypothetical protein
MRHKFFPILFLTTFLTLALFGQDRAAPDPQIRKLKIEFVTDKMSLTQTQLQSFLPVYNKYSDELLFQKKALKELDKNTNSQYVVDQRQKLEQKIVEIKGRYKNDFLKIISAQQLAAMYKAENEFKTAVLEQYKKRNNIK